MKIYTGTCAGDKFQKVKELGLGIMISPSPTFEVRENFKEVFCALDNGAFQAHRRGYPFQEKLFLETIDSCYKANIELDFIVCPDIVAGGKKSLDFSMEWSEGRLKTAPNLALVLQDGITPDLLRKYGFDRFEVLFVGGTMEWKKSTFVGWAEFCKSFKKQCHVGQCGPLPFMELCEKVGVTSIDSTSFARNDSWDVVRTFLDKKRLFV